MNYRVPTPNVKEFSPKIYPCYRAQEKHILDGNLEKSFWEKAPFTEDFQDIEGDLRPTPRYRTRVKMLWDDEAVYFGAELWGDEIWATLTERDCVIFQDNDFEIFIDPDNDTHAYCEFEMNALNTVWDLLLTKPYRDGGFPLNSFDIKGLKTAVKIEGTLNHPSSENQKWTAEIVIPFTSVLECCGQNTKNPKRGDFWRINFSRVHWTVDVVDGQYQKRLDASGKPFPEDNWVWSPMGIVNMHYPELWGYLFFCQDEKDEVTLPPDEYLKWEMRKIYYALHKSYDEKGFFSVEDIVLPHKKIKVFVMPHGFEICSPAEGGGQWILHSDSQMLIQKEGSHE